MPKDYTGDPNLGHRFGPADGNEKQKCRVCGLTRVGWARPAITCPEEPLDDVFPGWKEKYGS